MLHTQQNWAVKAKSDESPLTAADLAANNLICDSLKEKYPSIPMCVLTTRPTGWLCARLKDLGVWT